MGYGSYWEELNKERVESFLFNLPLYKENLRSYPRQGNSALLAQLDALIAKGGSLPATSLFNYAHQGN